MARRSVLSRVLAIAGSVLVWFPIVAMVGLSIARLVQAGRFRMDYLIPAELFPVVLLGAVLLLWAAIRERSHVRIVAWTLGTGVGALVLSQGLAVATGLASGENEASGWRLALVAGILGVYVVTVFVLGVAAISLTRNLFRSGGLDKPESPWVSAAV